MPVADFAEDSVKQLICNFATNIAELLSEASFKELPQIPEHPPDFSR